MPYVIIRYGPYLCHGIIAHRKQKINGLIRALNDLGYEIEVIAINQYNRLSIEMFDREVFRCDIRYLQFNMPAEDDAVCQRAIIVVEEAKSRICADKNLPGYPQDSKDTECLTEIPSNLQFPETSSKAEVLFETRDHSIMHITNRGSETSESKIEEKVGKVTIMEDKTTFSSPFGSLGGESQKVEET